MTIRTIMLPIRGDNKGEFVLSHAHALARGHGAHIVAVHCRPQPEDLIPFGVLLTSGIRDTIREQAGTMADEEEKRLRALFADYCKSHKLKLVDKPSGGKTVSASWREFTGKQAAVIGVEGRLADIVAVAQPDGEGGLGANTLESALFDTGRLVMMCPDKMAERVGESVAVAWNGSTEAARAVALALPVLGTAKKVVILGASDEGGAPLSTAALAAHLAAHGIDAENQDISAHGSAAGDALLTAADSAGADCLVMGAFGHSRRRELVMGGVTQHVVDHTKIPVFFAH